MLLPYLVSARARCRAWEENQVHCTQKGLLLESPSLLVTPSLGGRMWPVWQVAWPCASLDVKSGTLGAAERQVLQNFNLLMAPGG